jgi:hypothetical protein
VNNYWLDRKSSRLLDAAETEKSRHRLEKISSSYLWMNGRPLPVTHKLELRQNGRIVLPSHFVRMAVVDDTLIAKFQDDGNFPIKTYEWLAFHAWGKTPSKLDINATVRVSVFNKPLSQENAILELQNAKFTENKTDNRLVEVELVFKIKG